MNPAKDPQIVDEFVLRRLLESFSDWTIVLPVLFAIGVLFIIACLRREKGMATLGWGMCDARPRAAAPDTAAER